MFTFRGDIDGNKITAPKIRMLSYCQLNKAQDNMQIHGCQLTEEKVNLHQTSHGVSKHLNTTFHIEKNKNSLVDYGVFFIKHDFFFRQIRYAHTKVMHDCDVTLH